MYNRRFLSSQFRKTGNGLNFIRTLKAIIAEKPSVGMDIARVVGADRQEMTATATGNGYMVTWALGHLVSLALPETFTATRKTGGGGVFR